MALFSFCCVAHFDSNNISTKINLSSPTGGQGADMIVLLLFLVPLIGGLLSFFLKNDKSVRTCALLVSLIALAFAIAGNVFVKNENTLQFSTPWMGTLNSNFSLKLDGIAKILCLLTAVSYPI